MSTLPLRPLRAVPPESFGAVIQNNFSTVENAVRVRADLRNVADDLRELAIDTAISKLRQGASSASAIEAGWNQLKGN